MTDITLLVITDGRGWCLQRTLESFASNVDQELITRRVIVNDAAEDPSYQNFIDDLCPGFDFRVSPASRRRGFSGAIEAGWQTIRKSGIPDYVFHLEDDFQFNRPVDISAMVDVLDTHPGLVQMCLRRQPWNSEEQEAGGVVELHPDYYTETTDGVHEWLEHRVFFSTNPSLYEGRLIERGWPQGENSEGHFSIALFRDSDVRVGYWGARSDEPWVHHFGVNRIGAGY